MWLIASGSASNSGVQQRHGFGRAAGTPEDQREIGARGGEVRRNLQRAAQQSLGVPHAADPRRKLGQHPDRPDVERIFLEVRLQQPFRDVEAVLVERQRRLDQARMPARRDASVATARCVARPLRSRQAMLPLCAAACDISRIWKSAPKPTFGSYEVTREEVLEFAHKYDPQPFHLSDEAAAKTHFGRIAASGWHTCAMTMAVIARYVVDDEQAGLGSPGVDELRWLKPVYPGDTLHVRGRDHREDAVALQARDRLVPHRDDGHQPGRRAGDDVHLDRADAATPRLVFVAVGPPAFAAVRAGHAAIRAALGAFSLAFGPAIGTARPDLLDPLDPLRTSTPE